MEEEEWPQETSLKNKEALKSFMEICSTVVRPAEDTKLRTSLALAAVKIKNEAGLDLSNPAELHVNGRNPLYEACRAGHVQIVKLFLGHGACLNVVDGNGASPLYAAISSFHCTDSMVDFLLNAGADVNLHKEGMSPLLASFYNMKINTAIKLIQKGANVNNAVLPSFCFVESMFSLSANLVMMASGIRFQLGEFDQLMNLSTEIVRAGLSPRTFYMSGRKSHREWFTSDELAGFWHFQSMCLAIGFKVDQLSLREAMSQLQQTIDETSDLHHRHILYQRLEHFLIMDHIMMNPLSLTRLTRMAIRSHLAKTQICPARHLNEKIKHLPLPIIMKDFIALKGL